jgi:choline kinase
MKAIILAAGRGSRLKSMTDDRPKCLVEVQGRRLLDIQIAALSDAGIAEIAIVTGYRREMLALPDVKEFHNPDWARTNMVASLACAAEWLEQDVCIVSYSDIFYPAAAPKLLVDHTADLAITYDPDWRKQWEARFGDPLLDAETFRLDATGNVAEIGRKPQRVEEIEGQYMGLLRFAPAGWAEIARLRATLPPETRDKIDMTSTLQRIVEAGRVNLAAVPFRGEWGEIDTELDLRVFNALNK